MTTRSSAGYWVVHETLEDPIRSDSILGERTLSRSHRLLPRRELEKRIVRPSFFCCVPFHPSMLIHELLLLSCVPASLHRLVLTTNFTRSAPVIAQATNEARQEALRSLFEVNPRRTGVADQLVRLMPQRWRPAGGLARRAGGGASGWRTYQILTKKFRFHRQHHLRWVLW